MRGFIKVSWRKEANGTLKIEITIPANTSAKMYIPCTRPKDISESGISAEMAQGIIFERTENGYSIYNAGSGSYIFEFPYNNDGK